MACFTPVMEAAFTERPMRISSRKRSTVRMEAVSYTHLDVYKRQRQATSSVMSVPLLPNTGRKPREAAWATSS